MSYFCAAPLIKQSTTACVLLFEKEETSNLRVIPLRMEETSTLRVTLLAAANLCFTSHYSSSMSKSLLYELLF